MTNRVPQNWEKVRIGDVTESFGGTTPFTQEPKYWEKGTIPWATPTDVTSLQNKYISFTKSKISQVALKETALKLLDVGDILMTSRATIGYPAIATKSICTNQGFINIICSHRISNIYMFYWIEKNRKYMQRYAQGSTFLELNKKDFRKIEILLPPLPEQCQIAAILSTVDDAIEKTNSIIKKTKRLKKELRQKLFTEGIGHTRFKDTEIGAIPKAWEVKQLQGIALFANGKAHEQNIVEKGKYTVVNSKFISTEGKVVKYSNENICPLYSGDVVMVMSDVPKGKALAKCYLIREDNKYTLNQRICSLKAVKVNNLFLFYLLDRNRYFLRFDNGVGQTNLRRAEVLECPLALPPLDEQRQIVQILSVVDEKIEKEKTTKEQLQLLKKGLMQVLLTGKVRVKV